MDASEGGGAPAAVAAAAAEAAGGFSGFIHAVMRCYSSPLFFWLLTVALVAAIHLASSYFSPSRSEDDKEAERKARRGGGFAGGGEEGEEETAGRNDDKILEMMRSFSFMHASEEDFMEGMVTYDRVVATMAPEPVVAPLPSPPSTLSFKFQHQLPEILRETTVVSGEIPVQVLEEHEVEKKPAISLESVAKQERELEAEEREMVVVEEEEEEQSREVVEAAAPRIVATTHNYRFLTERDFRGFVKEPEAITVRVQESFVPSPELEAVAVAAAQPEERRVVDGAPRRGFFTETDFRPSNEPSTRHQSVASPEKRTPSQRRKRAASSPSAASKGSAVSGRTSFASEFSGFGGDSDSESTASDGYSVKELVVDSDSDWFLSEKDFPAAAAHDAGSLRGYYKTKMLKALEALDESASNLERSFQGSATTVSPGSVGQASPDSIADGSAKYPEDMWSRSPSPDVEYKEEEHKGTGEEAEEAAATNMEEEEEVSFDMSDDERSLSPDSKKTAAASLVHDADSEDENSLDHSEKETITINDHSYVSVSDVKRSPEAISDRKLDDVSSHHVPVLDAKMSSEQSEREPVGMNVHSSDLISDDIEELAATNDQSQAAVSDDKGSPLHSERKFAGDGNDQSQAALSDDKGSPPHSEIEFAVDGHSHELISDVWKEIVSAKDQSLALPHDEKRSPDPSEKEFVGTDVQSVQLVSDGREAIVSTMDDPSYAIVSDDKSIPETPEQELSANDHSYELVTDARIISEPTEERGDIPNDRPGNATRHVTFSIAEKGKVLDEVEEDQEDKWKDLTEEEEDELESLWEHQDLIEQLKLELKKVRSIGLPTILEESETPKTPMEDLKPWRIDAKFLREDPMDELNKFFKSYRERMRKFDILCYQKMYAIDFLQLRGPQQSANSLKSLSPTVTSILSHSFRSSRRKSPEDPSERFLKELRYDLETVYVGQMCLSWEFLRWQYEQARDLPESDPYHSHQYNQVAGEFQQFQVVVQRFVEDESFKGPRLPNYINNRCVLRNLLQVPVIKEDSLKDRMEDQRKGNYVITSEELEEIMEECMRVFWEFIRSDKVETTSVLKGLSSTHVELQDPLDHDLMMHIHATLQKKEKRLKDLLRTGNCIVKKFKKPKEDNLNQNLFFSQVDMRLVARVLRMPRITSEQLQWCKAKLDKIALVDRRIHREASFLLFPC
ncbi:hypothetical protein E2562_036099 [Oryza meyeriana var. granulata]|uniref:Uncharacterized protein n=1 Tax=Oryza meyeriana var. granulata TaxID=110450 RepID=A0A6G1DSN3_9ORYZ|nr:hypothetical protein E2562_036099 [Oryza meyeriana var. granulata]